MKIELNFSSEADSVQFPVVAASPTAISLLKPFVPDDFFESLLVSL